MKRRLALLLIAVLALGAAVFAYGFAGAGAEEKSVSRAADPVAVSYSEAAANVSKETNTYAELFSIGHSTDSSGREYSHIEIYKDTDSGKVLDTAWLLLPEGVSVTDAPENVYVMTWQDRQNILVSSASTLALINAMGALGKVPMTTSDTTWYIQDIKDAIAAGTIQEVGKYNTPDYERILTIGEEKNVTFAVFSTMIDYVPEVYDRLTSSRGMEGGCGLRIMRDQSSSENHPLARTEWIKIYGEIFDMREEADEVFDAQDRILRETTAKIDLSESERKSVLIFYSSEEGKFNVRNANDYVTELVNLGGGKQVAPIGVDSSRSNTTMTQEEFIEVCSEADYVLYNWTSGSAGVADDSLQGLIDARLGEWFKDFKAYKEGNVWRTSNDFYQKMDKMGEMVADIYSMLYDENASDDLTYVNRLTDNADTGETDDGANTGETGCGGAVASASIAGLAVIAMGIAAAALLKKKKA